LDLLLSSIVRDLEFQAKLDQYNKIMSQAYEIVKHQRQEELEDNDIVDGSSSSDLTEPTSSLFNGIEGVELSGGNSKDHNRSFDNNSDNKVQDSDIGIKMGSDDEVAKAISPRRMRSGRIVKYQDN
jgi:hypothetical protein